MNYFKSVDEFYELFFNFINKDLKVFFNNKDKLIKDTKNKFPHYSINDIKFRLIRDKLLNKKEYEKIMFTMFEEKKFNPKDFYEVLFFTADHIK